MRPSERYVVYSLDLHLFFARIMKEHSLFLMAGFTPANPAFTREAEQFKRKFEALLARAIALSDGVVSREVLNSGEIFTPFTDMAEQQTEHFTGIQINRGITAREALLRPGFRREHSRELLQQVQILNQEAQPRAFVPILI